MQTKTCPTCDGKGVIADRAAVGDELQKLRLESGVSLRSVAKRMKISAQFLSQLERKLRNWTPKLEAKFRQVVAKSTSTK